MPHVARWLTGLATSLVGNQIYLVALSWVAVQTTTPAKVGWILVAGAIPQAALLLLGGVFVDRLGPKRIIIASDLLRTLVMVVFALVVSTGATTALLLGVLSVVFGIVDGFFLPAISTAPRYLAGRDAMTRLMAAKTMVARGAEFAGSPLASWLLIAASTAAAFWANAILFAVSVVALAATRMVLPTDDGGPASQMIADTPSAAPTGPAPEPPGREQEPAGVWAELVAGARLIVRERTLANLLVVVFVMELGFAGPMTAGVPLLAKETGWGVGAVGWILGGFGVGAAVAAGLLAWRKDVARAGLAVVAGLAAMGLSVVLIGVVPAFGLSPAVSGVLAGALGVTAGIGSGFFGTLVSAAVLQLAPTDQIGRVMSALSFSSLTAVPIGFALTGLITGEAGARVPFLLGGALVLAAAALAGTNKQVRRLTMEPAPVREPASV